MRPHFPRRFASNPRAAARATGLAGICATSKFFHRCRARAIATDPSPARLAGDPRRHPEGNPASRVRSGAIPPRGLAVFWGGHHDSLYGSRNDSAHIVISRHRPRYLPPERSPHPL
ncbi:hypothetical protein DB32_007587 [Sandaracinus amylolyticus]|uniref:Uncharacterized protein n=1 Tax=Sandaracinus amylolyticus TaxID=927083 RepID=A0A0F6YLJ2_9BACT|nr:hypothetical protein DB32_007587 [Sandaracinus amylolyticus]